MDDPYQKDLNHIRKFDSLHNYKQHIEATVKGMIRGIKSADTGKPYALKFAVGAQPHVDGKAVVLPTPSPFITRDEADTYFGYALHETAHVKHSPRGPEIGKILDKIMAKYTINLPMKLAHYIWNAVEDTRVECITCRENSGSHIFLTHIHKATMDAYLENNTVPLSQLDDMKIAFEAIFLLTKTRHLRSSKALTTHPMYIMATNDDRVQRFLQVLTPCYDHVIADPTSKDKATNACLEILRRIAKTTHDIENERQQNLVQKSSKSQSQGQSGKGQGSASAQGSGKGCSSGTSSTQQSANDASGVIEDEDNADKNNTGDSKDSDGASNAAASNPDAGDTNDQNTPPQDATSGPDSQSNNPASNPPDDVLSKFKNSIDDEINDDGNSNKTTDAVQEALKEALVEKGESVPDMNTPRYSLNQVSNKSMPSPDVMSSGVVEDARTRGKEISGPLRSMLATAFLAPRSKYEHRFMERGVFDIKSASHFLIRQNTNIFKGVKKVKDLTTAVHLTLDVSGSMGSATYRQSFPSPYGNEITHLARITLAAFDCALRGLHIPFSASMFWDGYTLIKTKNHKLTDEDLARLHSMGCTDLGKAIVLSSKVLASERTDRKILLAVTDGDVSNDVTSRIRYAYKELGVETYLIGIGPSSNSIRDSCLNAGIDPTRVACFTGNFDREFINYFKNLLTKGQVI